MSDFRMKEEQMNDAPTEDKESSISNAIDIFSSVCSSSIRTITELTTNMIYTAKHSSCPFINRKVIELTYQSEPVYLLGKGYSYKRREEFEREFHEIIWICYRSELEGKGGDVGWGCMIRVCQMVLAEALKRNKCNKQHKSYIIEQFSEQTSAILCFNRICEKGNINKRWTSSGEIISILQAILSEQKSLKLTIEMYNCRVSIEDVEAREKYPLLLVVQNRLGEHEIDKTYFDHLTSILRHPNSMGIISGIGGEALYVAGYHEKCFIALDPHYVQMEQRGKTNYSNSTPRGVPFCKVVPSVGFCFQFSTPEEHKNWIYDVAEGYYHHYPNVVIECDDEFAKTVYNERHPKQEDSDSGDFQVLE